MPSFLSPRLWALLVCLVCSVAHAESEPEPTTILWRNTLESPADLHGSDGRGALVDLGDRTALRIEQSDAQSSALRTFDVPVGPLRGKWIYLSADVRAEGLTAKPQDWNGIKVMLKMDTPAGTQWPQLGLPGGTFDWKPFSTRILVPEDATKLTLHLGLELVAGAAWFDDVRVTLAREARETPAAPADRPIFKGHSLPALRGAMAHPEMKREDLRVFAEEWGGNLVRWQLLYIPGKTPPDDLAAYDRWLDKALAKLDDVLLWSRELGVKVVVDLHSPPGGHVAREGGIAVAAGAFWSTPAAQEHFLHVWRRIAERYRHEHDVIWGFDLLNEPDDRTVTEAADDWQTLAARAAAAVREIDPRRTLLIEPATWGSPEGFDGFEPIDLPNIVYSFHMYSPFEYTHQGVDAPADPLAYPGVINGKHWDRAALEASMAPAVAFAKKTPRSSLRRRIQRDPLGAGRGGIPGRRHRDLREARLGLVVSRLPRVARVEPRTGRGSRRHDLARGGERPPGGGARLVAQKPARHREREGVPRRCGARHHRPTLRRQARRRRGRHGGHSARHHRRARYGTLHLFSRRRLRCERHAGGQKRRGHLARDGHVAGRAPRTHRAASARRSAGLWRSGETEGGSHDRLDHGPGREGHRRRRQQGVPELRDGSDHRHRSGKPGRDRDRVGGEQLGRDQGRHDPQRRRRGRRGLVDAPKHPRPRLRETRRHRGF
jgi:hypothetical protein